MQEHGACIEILNRAEDLARCIPCVRELTRDEVWVLDESRVTAAIVAAVEKANGLVNRDHGQMLLRGPPPGLFLWSGYTSVEAAAAKEFLDQMDLLMDGSRNVRAIPVLVAMLGTGGPGRAENAISARAAETLLKMGETGRVATRRALAADDRSVRWNAALSLATLLDPQMPQPLEGEAALAEVLAEMLGAGHANAGYHAADAYREAINAFQRMGSRAVPYLIRALSGEIGEGAEQDDWQMGNAARLLAEMEADEAVGALLEALTDTRRQGGAGQIDVVDALCRLAGDNPEVERAVVEEAVTGGGAWPEHFANIVVSMGISAVPLLLEWFDKSDQWHRYTRPLGSPVPDMLRSIGRPALDELIRIATDPSAPTPTRVAALGTYKQIDLLPEAAKDAVLSDPIPEIRLAASSFLDATDDADRIRLGRMAELDPDAAVRSRAAKLLAGN